MAIPIAEKSFASELPCKVCATPSPLYGVNDFNKNCEEDRGFFLPLSGIPIYYHRCPSCGLVFTSAFDDWTKRDFMERIYNQDYLSVDPDYSGARARNNAGAVVPLLRAAGLPRLLDYGGGNGMMARLLRDQGYAADSWDPMHPDEEPAPKGAYGVVTAFEVFEHTPDPRATFLEASERLSPGGVLCFSTLTIDHLPPRSVGYWYIAPRNGHITIHTRRSLGLLAAWAGYQIHHVDDLTHLAFKQRPAWLA